MNRLAKKVFQKPEISLVFVNGNVIACSSVTVGATPSRDDVGLTGPFYDFDADYDQDIWE